MKTVRKMLSLCIVLAMAATMGTTAFAVEAKTYDLKSSDGTTIGSMKVTNVVSDTVSGGITDGANIPTIKITKGSTITYSLVTEGVSIADSQGEPIFEKETVVKISNANPLNPDDEILTYDKGYTIQFITTGTYKVGINGEIGGMMGSGLYSVNFEVTDGADSVPATPVAPAANAMAATPTNSKVLVNGSAVEFDAYTINDNNYFKLRDVAKVVSGSEKQFEVAWNSANNAIELVSGQPYTVVGGELAKGGGTAKNAALNTSSVYKDGAAVELTAYTIDNNNYFKLRDLGQAFNFNVSWDGANNCIVINTAEGYTAE